MNLWLLECISLEQSDQNLIEKKLLKKVVMILLVVQKKLLNLLKMNLVIHLLGLKIIVG